MITDFIADRVEGLQAIKEKSGITIVQNPEEVHFPEIPSTPLQKGIQVDHQILSSEISKMLHELTGT